MIKVLTKSGFKLFIMCSVLPNLKKTAELGLFWCLYVTGQNYVQVKIFNQQYSSQIVETGAICLEFSPNFLHSLLTPLFSLKCALSFPNVEPHVFWSTETTVIPKSTLGKGKITPEFQDLWQVLYLDFQFLLSPSP